MFERNRVDHNSQFATTAKPVRIVLQDGSELRGRLVTRETHRITTELNQDGQFVEFEPYGGDLRSLSKDTIREVIETNVPADDQLVRSGNDAERFDPHKILKLPRGAAPEAVRNNYVILAKTYHPDRFAALDMPDEIIEYVVAMSRRINAAYSELMPSQVEQPQSTAAEDALQHHEKFRQHPVPAFEPKRAPHPQAR